MSIWLGVTKFGPTHLIECVLLSVARSPPPPPTPSLHPPLSPRLPEASALRRKVIIGQLPSIRHDLPKPLSSDEITSSTTWYVLIWKGVGSDRAVVWPAFSAAGGDGEGAITANEAFGWTNGWWVRSVQGDEPINSNLDRQ